MKNDRRLSSFYGPDTTPKAPLWKSEVPGKVCLIAAAVLMVALMGLFMYTGSAVMYIHAWVYIAAVGLIVLLLLAAGGFAIYNAIRSERASKFVGLLMIAILLLAASVGFALCQVAAMRKPVSFHDSPNGENRIVVMAMRVEQGAVVTAYPAIGNHFFVAGLESEEVLSNGVISGVEWEGERLARVRLEDAGGNETELTVDFSILYGDEEAAE